MFLISPAMWAIMLSLVKDALNKQQLLKLNSLTEDVVVVQENAVHENIGSQNNIDQLSKLNNNNNKKYRSVGGI